MESENDEPIKKTIKNLHLFAKPASEKPQHEQVVDPIAPHILELTRPKSPPPPIHIRLQQIRAMTEDELMKWLTTESEMPGRPLDEGTKMAITTELMRRQALKFERPPWWKDRNYLIALVAAVGGVIAAVPVVVDWLKK